MTDHRHVESALERDPEVLRDIGCRFGGRLALNAEVLRGGSIAIGDEVRLVGDAVLQAGGTARDVA